MTAPSRITVDFTKQADQASSRLLLLPPELLNQIWLLVACTTTLYFDRSCDLTAALKDLRHFISTRLIYREEKARLLADNAVALRDSYGKPAAPGFLLACKAVYLEYSNSFYAQAGFRFETIDSLDYWKRSVERKKRDLVGEMMFLGKRYSEREGFLIGM